MITIYFAAFQTFSLLGNTKLNKVMKFQWPFSWQIHSRYLISKAFQLLEQKSVNVAFFWWVFTLMKLVCSPQPSDRSCQISLLGDISFGQILKFPISWPQLEHFLQTPLHVWHPDLHSRRYFLCVCWRIKLVFGQFRQILMEVIICSRQISCAMHI